MKTKLPNQQLQTLVDILADHFNVERDRMAQITDDAKRSVQNVIEKNTTTAEALEVLRRQDVEHSVLNFIRNSIVLQYSQDAIVSLEASYDPVEQKVDEAVIHARRRQRMIEPSIGWRNHIRIEGHRHQGGMMTIEKTEAGKIHWGNNKGQDSYNGTAIFYVDENYIKNVKDNGIEVVDIAGKEVLTLAATKVDDHDMVDQGVELFEATVAYAKVPRDVDTWQMTEDDVDKIFHCEQKFIAKWVNTSSTHIATGKDASWALRTMRSRMKKDMMKQMGLA